MVMWASWLTANQAVIRWCIDPSMARTDVDPPLLADTHVVVLALSFVVDSHRRLVSGDKSKACTCNWNQIISPRTSLSAGSSRSTFSSPLTQTPSEVEIRCLSACKWLPRQLVFAANQSWRGASACRATPFLFYHKRAWRSAACQLIHRQGRQASHAHYTKHQALRLDGALHQSGAGLLREECGLRQPSVPADHPRHAGPDTRGSRMASCADVPIWYARRCSSAKPQRTFA